MKTEYSTLAVPQPTMEVMKAIAAALNELDAVGFEASIGPGAEGLIRVVVSDHKWSHPFEMDVKDAKDQPNLMAKHIFDFIRVYDG